VSLFLLDTNMASFAMKRHYPQVRTHLARAAKKHGIGISAVTQGELIYGLHRKNAPNELVELIRGFLIRVEVFPWDTHVADTYGQVRAWCTKKGMVFSALDLMIAAHAIHLRATLVTNTQTFHRLAFPMLNHTPFELRIQDWTTADIL
jgi:tRNA(fMet)-specific endonuclease VapC